MQRARIISTGYYLPDKILTNKDLEKMVDTTEEWITKRTGIKERHIAAENEASSDMGTAAVKMALDNAGLKPEDIDCLICSTITPDHFFPSTACVIQKNLNLVNAFAFDISAACSGYLYAISVAESLLLNGKINNAIVVAAEKMSSITDWEDRSTCVLFGDGAGAVILKKAEGERGILSTYHGSDGSLGDLLVLPAGGSRKPATAETVKNREHFLQMNGSEVFKVAVRRMIESAEAVIEKAGIQPSDIKLLIPHQANLRIINAIAKRLNLNDDQIFINLDKTGNTSAATIAISLGEAAEDGRLKENDIAVLVSFGGGFTWSGIALRM